MKFNFTKSILISTVCLAAQLTYAAPNPQPTSCPSLDALKNVGVTSTYQDNEGTWFALQWKNNFETANDWTFGVFVEEAKNVSEALAKGNAAISTIKDSIGPINMSEQNNQPFWVCGYTDESETPVAFAITPSFFPDLQKFKKAIHR
jgi:hypothetical protein